jgi:hypothetical protein
MLEQLTIAAIVLGALLYVGRRMWSAIASARAPKGGCGSGCGCAPTSSPPQDVR